MLSDYAQGRRGAHCSADERRWQLAAAVPGVLQWQSLVHSMLHTPATGATALHRAAQRGDEVEVAALLDQVCAVGLRE